MPVLVGGIDYDDVSGVEEQLLPVTVHHDAPTAQAEE